MSECFRRQKSWSIERKNTRATAFEKNLLLCWRSHLRPRVTLSWGHNGANNNRKKCPRYLISHKLCYDRVILKIDWFFSNFSFSRFDLDTMIPFIKGQLISECPFGPKTSSKIPTKLLPDFCPEIFCSFLGASWKLFELPGGLSK